MAKYDYGQMDNNPADSTYPLEFRFDDAKAMGEMLRFRHSIELVGMKHVGIGNFLSFFLNTPGVVDKYINHGEKHFFIIVDLNNLVEREVQPFWVLVFKRLVDSLEKSELDASVKEDIKKLFPNLQRYGLFYKSMPFFDDGRYKMNQIDQQELLQLIQVLL